MPQRSTPPLYQKDIYSPFNSAYLYTIQQRQRATIGLLRTLGITSLAQMRLLEVGCGQGDALQEWMLHRLESRQFHAVDKDPARLVNARRRYGGVNFVAADGQHLPYRAAQFDLVMQYTMFSSILDSDTRAAAAREMRRVVKHDGLMLWYDFWINPTNRQTIGIQKVEIMRLFPNCAYTFRRVTLAPPLARLLTPLSWGVSAFLDWLKIMNTHYLVAIRPNGST
jgi:ubiquinone/menaquinone biosynthesis C-methylase UbiE